MFLSNSNTIVEDLYYLLWIKDARLTDASAGGISIPDTVIIKQNQISSWYFMSKTDSGEILRKTADHLNVDAVYASFTKPIKNNLTKKNTQQIKSSQQPNSGSSQTTAPSIKSKESEEDQDHRIVAELIMKDNVGSPHIIRKGKLSSHPANTTESMHIRYLTSSELRTFLYSQIQTDSNSNNNNNNNNSNKESQSNSNFEGKSKNDPNYLSVMVLQKFIVPNSESNSVIETLWSPSTCIFTRFTNRYGVNSSLRTAQKRGVTFDAASADNLSEKFSLKSNLVQTEIRDICESLVNRITNITYEETIITRMCAYFKTDHLNRVHLLYVSNIRLRSERVAVDSQFNNTPMLIINRIDSHLHKSFRNPNNAQQQNQSASSSLQSSDPVILNQIQTQCIECEKKVQPSDLFEIPIRYALQLENLRKKQEGTFVVSRTTPIQDGKTEIGYKSLEKRGNRNNNKRIEVTIPPKALMRQLVARSTQSKSVFDFNGIVKSFVSVEPMPQSSLLRKLYPKLTRSNLDEFKASNAFNQNIPVRVCLDCYVIATQGVAVAGSVRSSSHGSSHENREKQNERSAATVRGNNTANNASSSSSSSNNLERRKSLIMEKLVMKRSSSMSGGSGFAAVVEAAVLAERQKKYLEFKKQANLEKRKVCENPSNLFTVDITKSLLLKNIELAEEFSMISPHSPDIFKRRLSLIELDCKQRKQANSQRTQLRKDSSIDNSSNQSTTGTKKSKHPMRISKYIQRKIEERKKQTESLLLLSPSQDQSQLQQQNLAEQPPQKVLEKLEETLRISSPQSSTSISHFNMNSKRPQKFEFFSGSRSFQSRSSQLLNRVYKQAYNPPDQFISSHNNLEQSENNATTSNKRREFSKEKDRSREVSNEETLHQQNQNHSELDHSPNRQMSCQNMSMIDHSMQAIIKLYLPQVAESSELQKIRREQIGAIATPSGTGRGISTAATTNRMNRSKDLFSRGDTSRIVKKLNELNSTSKPLIHPEEQEKGISLREEMPVISTKGTKDLKKSIGSFSSRTSLLTVDQNRVHLNNDGRGMHSPSQNSTKISSSVIGSNSTSLYQQEITVKNEGIIPFSHHTIEEQVELGKGEAQEGEQFNKQDKGKAESVRQKLPKQLQFATFGFKPTTPYLQIIPTTLKNNQNSHNNSRREISTSQSQKLIH